MSSKEKIAFQGEPGAYSHLACNEAYPDLEPVACESFEDAFAAVSEGTAALAMIPIENTLGGRVADMHHLLPEASLYIINEHFQAIQHCLLGESLQTPRHGRPTIWNCDSRIPNAAPHDRRSRLHLHLRHSNRT